MVEIGELITKAAKVGSNYIPVVGPIISEIIDFGSSEFNKKRLKEFFDSVERKLNSHEDEIEKIKSDDFGFHLFLNATEKWIKDCEKEKKIYFVNCVKNGYLNESIEGTEKIIFLSKLSEYPMQLLILLNFLNKDHNKNQTEHRGNIKVETLIEPEETLKEYICETMPEFSNNELLNIFIGILQRDGFIKDFDLDIPEKTSKIRGKHTTNLGEKFVEFISDTE